MAINPASSVAVEFKDSLLVKEDFRSARPSISGDPIGGCPLAPLLIARHPARGGGGEPHPQEGGYFKRS